MPKRGSEWQSDGVYFKGVRFLRKKSNKMVPKQQ